MRYHESMKHHQPQVVALAATRPRGVALEWGFGVAALLLGLLPLLMG